MLARLLSAKSPILNSNLISIIKRKPKYNGIIVQF